MEISTIRNEIEKCLKLSYQQGSFSHIEKYEKDISTIDEIMASYFGKHFDKEINDYE